MADIGDMLKGLTQDAISKLLGEVSDRLLALIDDAGLHHRAAAAHYLNELGETGAVRTIVSSIREDLGLKP